MVSITFETVPAGAAVFLDNEDTLIDHAFGMLKKKGG